MKVQSAICSLLLFLVCSNHTFADRVPADALDALHQAGATANPTAFLALLSTDAVFMGVDGNKRLQGPPLRGFISDSFSGGKIWDFRVSQREITLSEEGVVAWFDESLEHGQLGHGWGSGVLIKTGEGWRIAQYNLTIPAPDNRTTSVEQETAVSEKNVSTTTSDDATTAETLTTKPEKKTECRRIRHKTNKMARC